MPEAHPSISLDQLLKEAAEESAKELSYINDAPHHDPSWLLSLTPLFKNEDFINRCKSTLGTEKVEKIKEKYDREWGHTDSKSSDSDSQSDLHLINRVIEKYGAPHLRPKKCWLEDEESTGCCWSFYNLINYGAEMDVQKSSE